MIFSYIFEKILVSIRWFEKQDSWKVMCEKHNEHEKAMYTRKKWTSLKLYNCEAQMILRIMSNLTVKIVLNLTFKLLKYIKDFWKCKLSVKSTR